MSAEVFSRTRLEFLPGFSGRLFMKCQDNNGFTMGNIEAPCPQLFLQRANRQIRARLQPH